MMTKGEKKVGKDITIMYMVTLAIMLIGMSAVLLTDGTPEGPVKAPDIAAETANSK